MAIDHMASGEIVDIRPLGPTLTESISTALFKSVELEVMRLVLRAGQGIPEHCVAGEMTIQCIEGALEVRAHARPQVLEAGHLMRLAGQVPYELHAIKDTSVLMTISMNPVAEPPAGDTPQK
jgi:quercetin dioxygenase-like cupin family protein